MCVAPAGAFRGPRLSYVRLVRVRIGGKKNSQDGCHPTTPSRALHHPSPCHETLPPLAIELLSSTATAPSFPANFFQILAPSARQALETSISFSLLPSTTTLPNLSHPFSFLPFARSFPLLVQLTCFSVPLCHLEEDENGKGEGVAVSSVGRGAREGSATKREEPSNGTISDERSLRVETRGRFPAGGSFFGETGGAGGMPSCRLCFCPLFLFVALQLTTLLLLRKRAAQGRRKREESEREEREDSRDKAASSCW